MEDILDNIHSTPKNLEEAIETLIGFYNDKLWILSGINEDDFVASMHFGDSIFIRNSWNLWYNCKQASNNNNNNNRPPKPKIVAYFNNLGIYHADDMSSIIMLSLHRKVNGKAIDLYKQVKKFKDFWAHPENGGYPDGIFLQTIR